MPSRRKRKEAGITAKVLLCHMQKEVLEELEHHFPLDLLVDMSEAAIDTLQASPWARCFLVMTRLLMDACVVEQWWYRKNKLRFSIKLYSTLTLTECSEYLQTGKLCALSEVLPAVACSHSAFGVGGDREMVF